MIERRRGAIAIAGVVLVAVAVAVVAWLRHDPGTPTAARLRDAVARVAGRDCPGGHIRVYRRKDIGGPIGLLGMRRASDVACDTTVKAEGGEHSEYGIPALAIDYVFDDAAAARRWLRESEYHLGPTTWTLRGRTLIGRGTLSVAQWRAVVAAV